jgi:methyl-accepting chemotaxis protein
MKKKEFRRKRYFLKEGSQPALILKTYLILLAVMVVSGTVFYFIGRKNLTEEFFQAHSVIKNTMQLLLPALIAVNVVGFVAAFFLVLLFTHSIAGPVHRLKILSEKISQGDFAVDVRFRKGDSLKELVEIINKILNTFKSRILSFQHASRGLGDEAEKIRNLENLSKEELRQLKEKLLAMNEAFHSEIKKIKL